MQGRDGGYTELNCQGREEEEGQREGLWMGVSVTEEDIATSCFTSVSKEQESEATVGRMDPMWPYQAFRLVEVV